MLSIDDIVKLLLAFSFAFAIVVVSWQIARLIGAVTANLQDIRKLVQNLGDVSDMLIDDYERVRDFIANIGKTFTGFQGFLSIFENLKNLKDKLPKFGKSGSENEDFDE